MGEDDVPGNWRNSEKAGGTPGYENSVTPKPIDVALAAISIRPERPSTRDSLELFLQIKNRGTHIVEECRIVVYDSLAGSLDLLLDQRVAFDHVAAGDSCDFAYSISPLGAGEHYIIGTLYCENDAQPENNSARLFCRVVETYPPKCIVLNEIMYDTDEKADEWIEIYNACEAPVNLAEWVLRDKRKSVVLTTDSCIIKPGEFAVLSNIDLNLEGCVQIIFNLPELNNSGDEIVLLDAAGVVIDSLVYDRTFGGGRYVSTERIRVENESSLSSNWSSCSAERGSTPGQNNSNSPKDYDAALRGSIEVVPPAPMAGEEIRLSIQVENSGRQFVETVHLFAAWAPMGESEFSPIDHTTVTSLGVGESKIATFTWPNSPSGIHIIRINLDMPRDMVALNNAICDTLAVSYPAESVVINEMMVSPRSDACEWIELFNKNDFSVELMNWAISDSNVSKTVSIFDSSYRLSPHGYLVLCADSSVIPELSGPGQVVKNLPSLNNSMDEVVLFDACGRVIESVRYTSSWGGATGRSLERINPYISAGEKSNWTTCVEASGHTAGAVNSVFVRLLPQTTTLSIMPDPFSPDGDGHDDFVALSYALPTTLAHVNIKIFDMKGRLVRFLLNNEPSGAQRTVYWDGLDDSGIACRMGIYIVFLQALNENKMCIEQARQTVVLAGAL